jgi:hypothetical protein
LRDLGIEEGFVFPEFLIVGEEDLLVWVDFLNDGFGRLIEERD